MKPAITKIVQNPKIGQLVYEPFSPQKVGVIRSIRKAKSYGEDIYFVNVEWITPKGVRTIQKNVDSEHLNDLEYLIADHQKKLDTHLASKKRLQTILKGEK